MLALDGAEEVDIELTELMAEERRRIAPEQRQSGQTEHPNHIRHVIAEMSGKGGVGKSLVSGLLAVALRRQQQIIGVLDADTTAPSIPKMLLPDDARLAGSGEHPQEAVLYRVLDGLRLVERSSTPPEIGDQVHHIVRQEVGEEDPYRADQGE